MAINNVSLAISPNGNNVYVAYGKYDTTDCLDGFLANGEVYLQYSMDNGLSWSAPINLTNSPTPHCLPGQCASDEWPCLAEVATDSSLHLFYTCYDGSGDYYSNRWNGAMLYLSYRNPSISVKDESEVPDKYTLLRAYPSPFNSSTTVSFELSRPSQVTLAIYNLLGQRVATLFEGVKPAEAHKVAWDADGVPSGTYFARLTTDSGERREARLVLVK